MAISEDHIDGVGELVAAQTSFPSVTRTVAA